MTTYRTGNHWGVTIVREGEHAEPCAVDDPQHLGRSECAQLVAVVVNGDQALAERICELLSASDAALADSDGHGERDLGPIRVACNHHSSIPHLGQPWCVVSKARNGSHLHDCALDASEPHRAHGCLCGHTWESQ